MRYFYSKSLFVFFVLPIFSGCCGNVISYSEYINENSFAPAKVGIQNITDSKNCEGQQIVITWSLPKKYVRLLPLLLVLSVRYGSGEIEIIKHSIEKCSGFWIFRIQGQVFEEKNGISSYKISIRKNDKELLSRCHHLWAEVISIPKF